MVESKSHGNMIPIQKPGKNSLNPKNYYPVALESCLCKICLLNPSTLLPTSKPKIYKKSCGQIRNLHNREKYPKTFHCNSFYLEKVHKTTKKSGTMKDQNILGLKGKLPSFLKKLPLKQEILSLDWINTVKLPLSRTGITEGTISDPLQRKTQHQQIPES